MATRMAPWHGPVGGLGRPRKALGGRHKARRVEKRAQGAGGGEEGKNPIAQLLKKAQGSLPVIGLLSRILSPDETFGKDVMAYQTYCRKLYDSTEREWSVALYELEQKHGRNRANVKYAQFCCWMAAVGVGIVPKKEIITSARRLRYSADLEYEIGGINASVTETMQKYKYISTDGLKVGATARVAVALEAICECCLGKKQGEEIDQEDAALIRVILHGAFPECPEEKLDEIFQKRAQPIVNK